MNAMLGLVVAQAQGEGDEVFVPADWAEPWWDLGPGMRWAAAAAVVGVWFLLFVVISLRVRPRRVRAGLGIVRLPSDEPPAVVDLITNSWVPEHEAVPATLLDLAARGYVSIHQVGEMASVHVPEKRPEGGGSMTSYEGMVLLHVEDLAAKTPDRVVPAGALSTGPDDKAKKWWKRFRSAVEADAVARGLAQKRWSGGAKGFLILTSLIPSVAIGMALSWAVYGDTSVHDDMSDAGRLGAGLLYAFIAWIGFIVFVATRRGVKDTSVGRQIAEQWMGLRQVLASDPTFTEHEPAGVSVWGRKLAYGAALGLAHGAVHGLPLGAENDKEIWSSHGGSWRVVHVRYPRWYNMAAGQAPWAAILLGLLMMVVGIMPALQFGAFFGDDILSGGALMGMGVLFMPLILMGLGGFFGLVLGISDLISPKRTVQGTVLRIQRKGSGKSQRWYVVVDDGMSSHITAWKFSHFSGGYTEGAVVRARVTRWLRHVSHVEVIEPATGSVNDRNAQWTDVVAALRQEPVAAVASSASGFGPGAGSNGIMLPDPDDISQIIGLPVTVDPNAEGHPMAHNQNGLFYSVDGKGIVAVQETNAAAVEQLANKGGFFQREVHGVGDMAVRTRIGGALFAKQGQRAVMVNATLFGVAKEERHRMQEDIARLVLREPL